MVGLGATHRTGRQPICRGRVRHPGARPLPWKKCQVARRSRQAHDELGYRRGGARLGGSHQAPQVAAEYHREQSRHGHTSWGLNRKSGFGHHEFRVQGSRFKAQGSPWVGGWRRRSPRSCRFLRFSSNGITRRRSFRSFSAASLPFRTFFRSRCSTRSSSWSPRGFSDKSRSRSSREAESAGDGRQFGCSPAWRQRRPWCI